MKRPQIILTLITAFLSAQISVATTINLNTMGVKADSKQNSTVTINRAISKALKNKTSKSGAIELSLAPGRYDFYPDKKYSRELYISNHDQNQPKSIGICLEGVDSVVLNGNGAQLIFHGQMLPVAMLGVKNFRLANLSIDFEKPHISQITIVENDTVSGVIKYAPAPWVDYEVRNGRFVAKGHGWENVPCAGIAFEPGTRHLVYNTSDISVGTENLTEDKPGLITAPWRNNKLIPGTIVAMRTYDRPAPGVFIADSRDVSLENVTIHYAEGMGLLAQMTENITLRNFNVCLKGDDDLRYFTTQADATHFSGCKGRILSTGGLYEGMMDDAINVHGTYLKVMRKIDERSVIGEYMHPQAFGFRWGEPGDSVQFISSKTMDNFGTSMVIESIVPYDRNSVAGAKQFIISFTEPLSEDLDLSCGSYGMENLTWTPEILFAGNIVRNNRARGALFSTPRKVVAERNIFDHTSGTAILLCGDCNGWFETGACRDVVIRNNKFVNALTNMFQFTNAVISIYPEIPDLKNQKGYFHSGVTIYDNEFDTFDIPLLYAKSVSGLTFMNNRVRHNTSYPAFHWNKAPVLLERVTDAKIQVGEQ